MLDKAKRFLPEVDCQRKTRKTCYVRSGPHPARLSVAADLSRRVKQSHGPLLTHFNSSRDSDRVRRWNCPRRPGWIHQSQPALRRRFVAHLAGAQQNLSKQIDLNPLQQSSAGADPNLLPGNPLALEVQPRQIEIDAEADVSSAALSAATGVQRADPTGLIPCLQPCAVRYAPAYSVYEKPATRYDTQWR
jgi:hypothetical protein